jgi:hypothetical protein
VEANGMNVVILSAALDTNGQNARYARASEKWGTEEGVVKALAVGRYDPASVVARFQAAAEKSDGLRIRSAHMATHLYQQMPADIVWDRTTQTEVYRLAEDADVIHLNNSTRAMRKIRMPIGRKPLVLHHHGSLLRDNPHPQLDSGRLWRAVQVVSTIDLLLFSEDLSWLPTAYDVDWLSAFGRGHGRAPDGRLRIVTCPTNRGIKSTAALEAAVTALQGDLDVELVIVENRPWMEAMEIKATADIYFDQVKLGYGCNAIEAWGHGHPGHRRRRPEDPRPNAIRVEDEDAPVLHRYRGHDRRCDPRPGEPEDSGHLRPAWDAPHPQVPRRAPGPDPTGRLLSSGHVRARRGTRPLRHAPSAPRHVPLYRATDHHRQPTLYLRQR